MGAGRRLLLAGRYSVGSGGGDSLDISHAKGIVISLLRQDEVKNHAGNSADGEASRHDERDGIEESGKRLVVALIGEDLVEVLGDKGRTVSKSETGRENKSRSAVEGVAGSSNNGHAGDGNSAEEERGHSAEDWGGNRDEGSSKLGKDSHDDEEEAAHVTSLAIGAASEGNDTVVLSKARHGSHGHESRQAAGDTVSEDTTLDARFVDLAVDFEARHITGGRDIANSFGGKNDIDSNDGQDQRPINTERECLDPDEGGNRSTVNAGTIKVASGSGNDAANEEANDDRSRLHDGGAESFAENDGDKDGESQTKILRRTPGKSMRSVDGGALGEDADSCIGTGAGTSSTHPVVESALDELDTDEHDGGAGDDGREHAQQHARRDEGHEDFDKGTDSAGTEEGTVSFRARELGSSG